MFSLNELMTSERELAMGDGATYREGCTKDAVFVLPGMVLDLEACAHAMDEAPGWDDVDLEEGRLVPAGDDTVVVVYEFVGRRGDSVYEASMSSVYTDSSAPRLVLHQQTPHPQEQVS